MMDWSKYHFDTDYRADYIKLNNEKDDKIATIVGQDKVLESIIQQDELFERIA